MGWKKCRIDVIVIIEFDEDDDGGGIEYVFVDDFELVRGGRCVN